MRRRNSSTPVLLLVALLTGGFLVAGAAPVAAGQNDPTIVVVEVDGILDPVTADLIERSLDEAEASRSALFVVTVDSPGSLDVDVDQLIERVEAASIPVAVWVKGGGSARGSVAGLALAAGVTAMATDAEIGPLEPFELDASAQLVCDDAAPWSGPACRLIDEAFTASEARDADIVDVVAPTLRDLVALLDGRTVEVEGEELELSLGEVVEGDDGEPQKRVLPITFRELGLIDQAQHALTSPFVAYLLLVTGLCLMVFEFFAIGVGLAALAGALLVVGAFVGFAHLPVDPISFGLVVAGFVALSVDVQAGTPRFWAVVGTGLFGVGSYRLYDGAAVLDPPIWQVGLVIVGALVFVLPGLAAVIRARFSTPTIGREWMVGESGTARTAVDPEGVVEVRGALWKARSTRAALIEAGDAVEVTGVEGLLVEVLPAQDDRPESGENGVAAPDGRRDQGGSRAVEPGEPA